MTDLVDPKHPVLRLANQSITLSYLADRAKVLRKREHTRPTIAAMLRLLGEAGDLERDMSDCRACLPEDWAPHTIAYVHEVPTDLESSPTWIGPVQVYSNIHVASVLNKYRSCRALCAELTINCMEWLQETNYELDPRYLQARYVEQQMIDEICYSIPFHLGLGVDSYTWLANEDKDGESI